MTTGHEADVEEYRAEQNRQLANIYAAIQKAESFADVIYEVEQQMLKLMMAERLTIYKREGQEIVS